MIVGRQRTQLSFHENELTNTASVYELRRLTDAEHACQDVSRAPAQYHGKHRRHDVFHRIQRQCCC